MTRRITSLSLFAAIMLAVSFALVNVFSFIVPFIIISIFVTLMGVIFSDEILDDKDRGGLTFFISIFTAICLIAIAVLIFVKPDIIYRDVHFGWLIALSILSALIMVIGVGVFEGEWDADSFMWISIIVNVASAIIIIVAVIVSMNTTYHLSKAKDMDILANAPESYKTTFVLDNDIDFSGEDVRWFGKRKNFKGVFNGLGHTLSNIETYPVKTRVINVQSIANNPNNVSACFGMVSENRGVIMNLNFKDCHFTANFGDETILFSMTSGYETPNGQVINCNEENCTIEKIQT